jgi:hypothetical protein
MLITDPGLNIRIKLTINLDLNCKIKQRWRKETTSFSVLDRNLIAKLSLFYFNHFASICFTESSPVVVLRESAISPSSHRFGSCLFRLETCLCWSETCGFENRLVSKLLETVSNSSLLRRDFESVLFSVCEFCWIHTLLLCPNSNFMMVWVKLIRKWRYGHCVGLIVRVFVLFGENWWLCGGYEGWRWWLRVVMEVSYGGVVVEWIGYGGLEGGESWLGWFGGWRELVRVEEKLVRGGFCGCWRWEKMGKRK